MSKVLRATCIAGVVTAEGVPVPLTYIFSEGVGASQGVLILDEDDSFYLAKTSTDLKTTLGKIASALGDIATALTLLDAKPLGTLPSVPAVVASVASITSLQAELTALQEVLK